MKEITYSTSVGELKEDQVRGFFVGWPNKPSEKTFLKLLRKSSKRIVALDGDKVVGFITAITDDTLSAYIPFLEVLPEYQKEGIGKELVRRMLDELKEYYMIDLLCDENLQIYYESLGMKKATGMMIRNYENQDGSSLS